MQVPPPFVVPPPPQRALPPPTRGAFLTILLVLLTLGATVSVALSLLAYLEPPRDGALTPAAADALAKANLFAALLSAARWVAAIGMWAWKKWGVYLFAMGSLLTIGLCLQHEAFKPLAYGNIITLVVWTLAIAPKWTDFRD